MRGIEMLVENSRWCRQFNSWLWRGLWPPWQLVLRGTSFHLTQSLTCPCSTLAHLPLKLSPHPSPFMVKKKKKDRTLCRKLAVSQILSLHLALSVWKITRTKLKTSLVIKQLGYFPTHEYVGRLWRFIGKGIFSKRKGNTSCFLLYSLFWIHTRS